MALPDRLPTRRPFSHGSPSVYPVTVSKRLLRAENATATELSLHELETISREIKAERELAANQHVLFKMTDTELEFYDSEVAKVGFSAVKQRILAKRLNDLSDLNDDVGDRYRR
jgi:hypothetical protein